VLENAMIHPQFKIGDKIRISSIPQSVFDMPPDLRDGIDGTLTVFKYLLERNEIHKVVEIDHYSKWPWIEFKIRDPDGKIRYHKLMIEPEYAELIDEET
jgi:hypothetical protein